MPTRQYRHVVLDRNRFSRDAETAWQELTVLKRRLDEKLRKSLERQSSLTEELQSWRDRGLQLHRYIESLVKERDQLETAIQLRRHDSHRLNQCKDQQERNADIITLSVADTEAQRDNALQVLLKQQELAKGLENLRIADEGHIALQQQKNTSISCQQENARRVAIHLRALVDGQAPHLIRCIESIGNQDEKQRSSCDSDNAQDPVVDAAEKDSDSHETVVRLARDGKSPTADEGRIECNEVCKTSGGPEASLHEEIYHLEGVDSFLYAIRNLRRQGAAAVDELFSTCIGDQ